jgi:hypothetical protein
MLANTTGQNPCHAPRRAETALAGQGNARPDAFGCPHRGRRVCAFAAWRSGSPRCRAGPCRHRTQGGRRGHHQPDRPQPMPRRQLRLRPAACGAAGDPDPASRDPTPPRAAQVLCHRPRAWIRNDVARLLAWHWCRAHPPYRPGAQTGRPFGAPASIPSRSETTRLGRPWGHGLRDHRRFLEQGIRPDDSVGSEMPPATTRW